VEENEDGTRPRCFPVIEKEEAMTRSRTITLFVVGFVAAIVVLVAAFSGGTRAPRLRDPSVLGGEVGDFYVRLVRETSDALAGNPSPAALQPRLDALRDRYTRVFDTLGAERAALGRTDRDTVDDVAYTAMQRAPETQVQAILRAAAARRASTPRLAAELESLLRLERLALGRPAQASFHHLLLFHGRS
jgi:hypothetical protein